MKPISLLLPLAGLLAIGLPPAACSAPAKAARQTVVGPAARITLISGQVDVRSNGKAAARPAQMNALLATHSIINTAARGQTEIQIGATVLRLDAESELEITRLDASNLAFNLHYGSAFARVSDDAARQFELRTAQGRVSLQEAAEVRVDAASAPDASAVRLFTGSARFIGNDGNNITLQSGTQLALRGGNISTTPLMNDEFDDWCLGTRSQARAAPVTREYTERRVVNQSDRSWDSAPVRMADDSGTGSYYPETVYVTTPTQTVVRQDYAPWIVAPLYVGAWLWLNNGWYWDRGARGHYRGGSWNGYRGNYNGGHHNTHHTGTPRHTVVEPPRPVRGTPGSGPGRHR